MDNIVKKLFEAGLLSEKDQALLQESFDNRVKQAEMEIRESVEAQVREEMVTRFDHDKARLVEAMDKILTDVVQKHATEREAEVAKLREAQARYDAAISEARQAYQTRLKERAKVLESFVIQKLTQEIGEFAEDRNAVASMRVKYASAIAECQDVYKQRMKENMSLMRKFVVEKLNEEMTKLNAQQTALNVERADFIKESRAYRKSLQEQYVERVKKMDDWVVKHVAKELAESKAYRKNLQEQYADRISKIDKFVVSQVSKELREFQEDKRALVQKKVELVAEARAKLDETKRTFVAKAAKLVDQKVTETMKTEMKQLHEELERNRQNMFGRRIFEAVASEFKNSYFAEGTEVKKLEKVVESLQGELNATKTKLTESKLAIDAASRKAKLAEEAASRTTVMGELLAPLGRQQRVVMQELLETVKTPQLREAYKKYLPAVLNEGSKKVAPQSRQTLSEASKEKSLSQVTGDQRSNRLLETVKSETQEEPVSDDTAIILKLAGITK